MFLNSLKAKSIYRKIKNDLKERSYRPFNSKIKTVAILQSEDRPFDPASLQLIKDLFTLEDRDIKQMTLVEKIEKKDQFDSKIFSEKKIGWNGTLKSTWIKDFCRADYDILINYYNQEDLSLIAVSVLSQAKFKVGLSEEFAEVNDLTVNVSTGQERLLIDEIVKYMRILKIIE